MMKGTATLSLLSALGASLCCLTPVLALVSGLSGAAPSLAWMEPARPYLIGLSVVLLGFAWYQKLSARKEDCCTVSRKQPFVQSTTFLAIVTALAAVVMAAPMYARSFYKMPELAVSSASVKTPALKNIEFVVTGMGCADCEPAVEAEVAKLRGVRFVKASCKKKNTVVCFDSTQTSVQVITKAINSTGYTVHGVK